MSLKHQADNFYLLILNSSVDLNDLKFFLTAGSPFAVTSKTKEECKCHLKLLPSVSDQAMSHGKDRPPLKASYMGLGGSWDE